MEIANPIYDVVFKYLMEDNKVAKIILSTLTDLDIIELEFLPQELSHFKDDDDKKFSKRYTVFNLSIYRLDFSARIKEKDGHEKLIIIEVQKSKFTNESMRFRKYLGKQYMNENLFEWAEDHAKNTFKSGIPILPIYFLGESFSEFANYPVIQITRTVKDRYSNELLSSKTKFIDSLFHEGIIINIPALRKSRRDDLEVLLSIFDQENRAENHHIMNVKEKDFPEEFRPIIRRLQSATQEQEVRDIMIIEDDFLSELQDYENRIVDERRLKEEERRLKEEAQMKQREAQMKQQEAQMKQREAQMKQKEAILFLLELGVSKEDVASKLNIPLSDLDSMIED
jgi:hypothetical protein